MSPLNAASISDLRQSIKLRSESSAKLVLVHTKSIEPPTQVSERRLSSHATAYGVDMRELWLTEHYKIASLSKQDQMQTMFSGQDMDVGQDFCINTRARQVSKLDRACTPGRTINSRVEISIVLSSRRMPCAEPEGRQLIMAACSWDVHIQQCGLSLFVRGGRAAPTYSSACLFGRGLRAP